MKQNPYMPIAATIDHIVEETPTIKTFGLRPEEPIAFQAGQFVELTVPGIGEAPFTPSSSPAVTDQMEITIMRVGRVTDALHQMSVGDTLGIRGPYGKAYPIEEFRGREILIVGGGCGVGPLRALLFALFEELDQYPRILVRVGARTPHDMVFRDAASNRWDKGEKVDVLVSVDHAEAGWTGPVGVVTSILDEAHQDCHTKQGVAVMCGPPVMMKFVSQTLAERGYAPNDIYLSLERNMSCGLGKCGHCRLGPYHVCYDGPVFSCAQLQTLPEAWD
jgi:NAD(P)H-flavin reductase